MNRAKMIWKILMHKPKRIEPLGQEKAAESVRVRALQRQVETLDDINQEYANQIKAMSVELAKHRENNFNEKLLEVGMNLFAPKSKESSPLLTSATKTPSTDAQTTLESGVQYSDSQLMTIAEGLGSSTIKKLKGLAFDEFAKVVKSQIPNISDTSIKRSREIIEVMAL